MTVALVDGVDHVETVEIVKGVTEDGMPAKERKGTLRVDLHHPLEVNGGALEEVEVSVLLAKQGCEINRGPKNT